MLDVPADVPHLWIGVAIASLVVTGVGAGLPTQTAPDARSAAATIDRVAATDHPATAEHPIAADQVKLGPQRIALRDDRGTSHATLAFGPVVPARGEKLQAVLHGSRPQNVFATPAAFRVATERARNATPTWTDAGDRLLVRKLTWDDVTVTVVGA